MDTAHPLPASIRDTHLRPRQVARLLGQCQRTVYRAIALGEIPAVRVRARALWVPREWVELALQGVHK